MPTFVDRLVVTLCVVGFLLAVILGWSRFTQSWVLPSVGEIESVGTIEQAS